MTISLSAKSQRLFGPDVVLQHIREEVVEAGMDTPMPPSLFGLNGTPQPPQPPKQPRARRKTGAEHQAALDACGHWYTYLDYATGSFRHRQHFCGLKDCPVCGARRGETLRKRVESADDALTVTLSHSEATLLVRTLGRSNYLRLPREDNDIIIFVPSDDTDPEILSQARPVSETTFDWTEVQNSPNGRIISGSLGKKPEPEPEEPVKTVSFVATTYTFDSEEDRNKARTQQILAIADTFDLDPLKPSQIQSAIYHREMAFENRLNDAGITYSTTVMYLTEKLSLIDWFIGISESFSSLVALNIITPASYRARFNALSEERRLKLLKNRLVSKLL